MEIMIIGIIIFAVICYFMAKSRGRSPALGAILGALFGIFAVIGYAIAGKTQIKKAEEMEDFMRAREEVRKK